MKDQIILCKSETPEIIFAPIKRKLMYSDCLVDERHKQRICISRRIKTKKYVELSRLIKKHI